MAQTVWTSPIASQEIVDGPETTISPGKVVVRFRGDDGDSWHRIEFSDVLKVVFTEFNACSEAHLDAYDQVIDLDADSQFARDVFAIARRDVTGFRHFCIFFDDVGAYDVVARGVSAV